MSVRISENMIRGFNKIREEDIQKIFEAVNKFQQQFPDNNAEIGFAYNETFEGLPGRDAARAFKGNGDPSIYIHETSREKIFTTTRGNKNDFCAIGTFLDKN